MTKPKERIYCIRVEASCVSELELLRAPGGWPIGFRKPDGTVLRPFILFEADIGGKGTDYEDITAEMAMEDAGIHSFDYGTRVIEDAGSVEP